jgi:hypothetical protein
MGGKIKKPQFPCLNVFRLNNGLFFEFKIAVSKPAVLLLAAPDTKNRK